MMEAIEPLHCQMLIVHSNDAMTVPERRPGAFALTIMKAVIQSPMFIQHNTVDHRVRCPLEVDALT
jgi:hypothetical protein